MCILIYHHFVSECSFLMFLHPSSDITEAALTISDLCSKTGVELPLRAATSTEPMSHTTSPQMSPSTRAVTSPTEISITSSSRSEIHQLPTSVYSVNDMPSCSTTNVRTESYPGNILLPRGNDMSNHEKTCSWK